MLLFIKHIDIEGPGTIAPFFEQRSFDPKIIELATGEALPEDLSDVEAVVVLGGPMNVYEEEKHPFLKPENEFIKKVLKAEIPLLGICLGSQLIAKACESKVTKSPQKEIGWSSVALTEEGKRDPLFEGFAGTIGVFQWHEDTFAIPEGGRLLATSSACLHQAFKIGKNAYGLQFHIEVTDEIIASWIERYFKVPEAAQSPEGKIMLDEYVRVKDQFNAEAEVIYGNFAKLIQQPQVNIS